MFLFAARVIHIIQQKLHWQHQCCGTTATAEFIGCHNSMLSYRANIFRGEKATDYTKSNGLNRLILKNCVMKIILIF